ncbi:MAG: protein kinase [Lentisphaerae bacterium]|nr:protein kinase [Lentisphaerota bacterium]
MADKKLSYHLLGHFTSGGVADLHSAVLSDGRRVLIRSLQSTKVLSLKSHLRFRYGLKVREVLTPHPNIIGSMERGYHGLQPYEIIEWFEGHSIKNYITNRNEQLYRELVYVLSEAAEGLAWVHASGYMHLDVKPENFLLRLSPTARPVVKLTDFDLVRRADDRGPRRQMGTPAYMPRSNSSRKSRRRHRTSLPSASWPISWPRVACLSPARVRSRPGAGKRASRWKHGPFTN